MIQVDIVGRISRRGCSYEGILSLFRRQATMLLMQGRNFGTDFRSTYFVDYLSWDKFTIK